MRRRFSGERSGPGGVNGFSVGELLAVLAIIALVVAVAIPLVSEQIRQAKIRGAADNYAMSLKAVRMIAVTKRTPQSMTLVNWDPNSTSPNNIYSYVDTHGDTSQVQLPQGVRLISSTTPITFLTNGSIAAQAVTVMEADLSAGVKETWTVTTTIMGVPTIDHARQ